MRNFKKYVILAALVSGPNGLPVAQEGAGFLSGKTVAAAKSDEKSNIPRVQVFERLDKEATLVVSKKGNRLFARDVLIIGDTTIQFSTGNSRYLMTLMAGEITTLISNKEVEREEGESWVIGSQQQVELITGDNSASRAKRGIASLLAMC